MCPLYVSSRLQCLDIATGMEQQDLEDKFSFELLQRDRNQIKNCLNFAF